MARNAAAVTVASFASMLTTAGASSRSRSTVAAGAGRGGATRRRCQAKVTYPPIVHIAPSSSQTMGNAGARASSPTISTPVIGVIVAS